MRPSTTQVAGVASALLFATDASAQALTTINPCPAVASVTPITVTAQYQPVSTCSPTLACMNGNCTTSYVFNTYPYLNTVIPCAWNGQTGSSCSVTATADPVIISTVTTTITRVLPIQTHGGKWRQGERPSYTTIYETRDRKVQCEYDAMGPLAMPGYPGSGLCHDCGDADGIMEQGVEVTECRKKSNQAQPMCRKRIETWASLPAKALQAPTRAVCSSRYSAPSAGVYTFSFRQTAPASTITSPPKTIYVVLSDGRKTHHVRPARTITIDEQPWYAMVTKSCAGPTIIDFTTTITTTVRLTMSYVTVTTTVNPTTTSASNTIGPIGGSTTSTSTSTSTSTASSTSTGSSSTTTGSTSSGSISSTSTTSSSATTTSATLSTPFLITAVDLAVRNKRATQYIVFNGMTAMVGDGFTSPPAVFQLGTDHKLFSDRAYIGTLEMVGPQFVSKFPNLPPGASDWFRDAVTNEITLNGTTRFCVDTANSLRAIFPSAPAAIQCRNVRLFVAQSLTSTTTTATSTTSVTGSTSSDMTTTGSGSSTSTLSTPSISTSTVSISTSTSEASSTTSGSSDTTTTTSGTMSTMTITSIATTTTGTVTTTTITSTTTTTGGFNLVVQVASPAKLRKRAAYFVAFDNNALGYLTQDSSAAAAFTQDTLQHLLVGGQYAGANRDPAATADNAALALFASAPNFSKWVTGTDNSVSVLGSIGACTDINNNHIQIRFSGNPPAGCVDVAFTKQPAGQPLPSSTTTSAQSTTQTGTLPTGSPTTTGTATTEATTTTGTATTETTTTTGTATTEATTTTTGTATTEATTTTTEATTTTTNVTTTEMTTTTMETTTTTTTTTAIATTVQ